MRFLEIIGQLGKTATSQHEKELLRAYYDRLREMVRRGCSDDEIEHRFCLMITCYIMRYVDKRVDYSQNSADYFLPFLKGRLVSEVSV